MLGHLLLAAPAHPDCRATAPQGPRLGRTEVALASAGPSEVCRRLLTLQPAVVLAARSVAWAQHLQRRPLALVLQKRPLALRRRWLLAALPSAVLQLRQDVRLQVSRPLSLSPAVGEAESLPSPSAPLDSLSSPHAAQAWDLQTSRRWPACGQALRSQREVHFSGTCPCQTDSCHSRMRHDIHVPQTSTQDREMSAPSVRKQGIYW